MTVPNLLGTHAPMTSRLLIGADLVLTWRYVGVNPRRLTFEAFDLNGQYLSTLARIPAEDVESNVDSSSVAALIPATAAMARRAHPDRKETS